MRISDPATTVIINIIIITIHYHHYWLSMEDSYARQHVVLSAY